MRTRAEFSEWTRRRLSDAAVMLLLIVSWFLIGCEIPVKDKRAEDRAVTEAAENLPTLAAVPAAAVTPVRTTPVTYDEADAAFREGRYDDAVGLFSSYVEWKPENPWGHYMLGLSARFAGQLETAEASFSEALARDPKHVKSLLNLSRVLIATGRSDEAVQELTAALELDSTSSEIHRLLGRAYHEMGWVEEAIASYQDAIALDESDSWAMNNLGYLLIQSGKYYEAIGPLARAVELDAGKALFFNNLGMALERVGYEGSARDAYATSVRLDTTHVKAVENLARVEERGVDLDVVADLPQFAQAFVDKVRNRRELAIVGQVPQVPPPTVPETPEW